MTSLQKIVLIVSAVVVIGGAFAEVTALQLLPFVVFGGLAYAHYTTRKHSAYIVALSLIMIVINFSGEPSWTDVILWAAAAVAYWKK